MNKELIKKEERYDFCGLDFGYEEKQPIVLAELCQDSGIPKISTMQRFNNKNIRVYNGHFGIDEAWGAGGAAVKMKITKLADLEGKEIKRFWTKIHVPGMVLFELVNGERHYVMGVPFLDRDINVIITQSMSRPGFIEEPTFHFKFID